jgi:hypothetical protein
MIKLSLTLLFVCFISLGFSQVTSSSFDLGSPVENNFRVKGDNSVNGVPFLFNDWKSGEVTLQNNEKYKIEKINLNASSHKFIYMKNDTMYEFFGNVKEVEIFNENNLAGRDADMVFKTNVNPEDNNFVQVLVSGKVTIFKQYDKQPEGENSSNGMFSSERKYVLHESKNALLDNKIIPIKYNSSVLDELVIDKKSQVEAYIKQY